jgi:hypothetical protein
VTLRSFLRESSLGLALPAALLLSALPAVSQEDATERTHADILRDARERLIEADFDGVIGVLRPAIDTLVVDIENLVTAYDVLIENLRASYLLLINTHVQASTYYYDRRQSNTSILWRDSARDVVVECLQTPGLGDTEPDPESDPPGMIDLFAEVRREIFGAFRVTSLDPLNADVLVGNEHMGSGDAGLPLERSNLPVGAHLVVVRAEGYEDETDEIVVSPGVTLERTYELSKKKGTGWWLLRGGAVAAGAVALGYLIQGDDTSGEPAPLPEPPNPPD